MANDESGAHIVTGTAAFLSHWSDSNDSWRIIVTLFSRPLGSMQAGTAAAQAIDTFYASLDSHVNSVEWLRKNETIITEMILCRIVDKFLSYLAELLREILLTRPEALLSERGNVDIRRILSASSLDDLKKELIDARILALSYKSVADLAI